MVQLRRPWLHVRRYRTILGIHARFISIFIHFPILFLVSSESGQNFLFRKEWKFGDERVLNNTQCTVCPCVFLFSCIRMSNCTQKPSMHTVRAPVLDSFSCLQTGWLSDRQSVEIRRVNHISLSALILNISRRRSLLVEVGKRFSKYWMDLHTKYR
jgi:hypothetical protein